MGTYRNPASKVGPSDRRRSRSWLFGESARPNEGPLESSPFDEFFVRLVFQFIVDWVCHPDASRQCTISLILEDCSQFEGGN